MVRYLGHLIGIGTVTVLSNHVVAMSKFVQRRDFTHSMEPPEIYSEDCGLVI